MNKKFIILITVIILIAIVGIVISIVYKKVNKEKQLQVVQSMNLSGHYLDAAKECAELLPREYRCCIMVVKSAMKKGKFLDTKDGCPKGYVPFLASCIGAHTICESEDDIEKFNNFLSN